MKVDLFVGNPVAYLQDKKRFDEHHIRKIVTSLRTSLTNLPKVSFVNPVMAVDPSDYQYSKGHLGELSIYYHFGMLFGKDDLTYRIRVSENYEFIEVTLGNRHAELNMNNGSLDKETLEKLEKLGEFNLSLDKLLRKEAQGNGLGYSSKLGEVIVPQNHL